MQEKKDYLTPAEVAQMLLVSPITVRQWAQRGLIQAEVTVGGHRRFRQDEVERFARSHGLNKERMQVRPFRLLVIEDDPFYREFLVESLRGLLRSGEVASASDGFEAGRKVTEFRPDAMILDLKMPGLDGFEVCRRLKAEPATRHIRVVAVTGFTSEENVKSILAVGAEACLFKPVDIDQLAKALRIPESATHAVPELIPESDS